MESISLQFSCVPGEFAICRLPAGSAVPLWGLKGSFFSSTGTPEEVSLVCLAAQVPADIQHQAGWACLKLHGPFPFDLTGILASFLEPLSAKTIPIFAISTFDTDYVLVPQGSLDQAMTALGEAGHRFAG